MPRPTLCGRISELVNLAQAEVPRVSEAARNPLRRRQPSAPWKKRCAWSGDSTASAPSASAPSRRRRHSGASRRSSIGYARRGHASCVRGCECLRDLCVDGSTVSRRQIGRIRDAFKQTLTELRAKELAKMVAKHLRATASAATGHVASNAATCVALPQPRAPLPPTQPEALPTPLPPTQPQGPPT